MDRYRLDSLTRTLATSPSRRALVRALTGGGLAALLSWPHAGSKVEAKAHHHKPRKKKKKHKQPQPQPQPQPLPPPALNAFGCVEVGQACRGDSTLCFSGICQGSAPASGQPDTSVCVAHNSGICNADLDSCTMGGVQCNPFNPNCGCFLTTGNAAFCGDFTHAGEPSAICRVCITDTDCQAEFGAGAACVFLGGNCTPLCATTGRTACLPACA